MDGLKGVFPEPLTFEYICSMYSYTGHYSVDIEILWENEWYQIGNMLIEIEER